MKVAVVFDTPYAGWDPARHAQQMQVEVSAWDRDEPEMEYQVATALQATGHEVLLVGVHDDLTEMIQRLAEWQPDLVFNAAEAFRGDAALDYVVAAVLEAHGYRFTGSPSLALLVTRNKAMSKKILAHEGISVPRFATVHEADDIRAPADLEFPLIVKPLQTDASAGIAQASVVRDEAGLAERVRFVHERFGQPAIVEEFVLGRELYVSILGNGDRLEILPLTEMVFDKQKTKPEERIATQYAKWDEPYRERRGIRNVLARRVGEAARTRLEESCRAAFRALWLRDYARLDVRLTPEGAVWVIEANANPFISYGHEVATAAEKAGMEYNRFVERIVREAMTRYADA